jgi:hypothetical protein
MATISITKSNGVISIVQDPSELPRSYFGGYGAAGKFYPSGKDDNGDYVDILLTIGGDSYQFLWSDLDIDGTAPTDFADALSLLTTLFSNL